MVIAISAMYSTMVLPKEVGFAMHQLRGFAIHSLDELESEGYGRYLKLFKP
jgi:hypothetical protein